MPDKIHEYRGRAIVVRYDAVRCIHAAECVNRLPAVFDTSRRRWVEPDEAPANRVAEVILRCPTGALHFERLDGGPAEALPERNTATLAANGPLYVRGNVEIKSGDGRVLLKDTRVALCRCGASKRRPLCDNSHMAIDFEAAGARRERLSAEPPSGAAAPVLSVAVEPCGPLYVDGPFELFQDDAGPATHHRDAVLCRCGGSGEKPFCDSTHHIINFTSE